MAGVRRREATRAPDDWRGPGRGVQRGDARRHPLPRGSRPHYGVGRLAAAPHREQVHAACRQRAHRDARRARLRSAGRHPHARSDSHGCPGDSPGENRHDAHHQSDSSATPHRGAEPGGCRRRMSDAEPDDARPPLKLEARHARSRARSDALGDGRHGARRSAHRSAAGGAHCGAR